MGRDKSLLPFLKADSLAQYQYNRLKPYFKEVYLSSKQNKFDFLEDKNLIKDTSNIHSPIVALNSIFSTLKDEVVFIITVDTPLVTIDTINKLVAEANSYDITIAQTKKVHNLCGVFRSTVLNKLDEMLKQDIHKVGYLIKNSKAKIVTFSNDDEFINLNFQEDYERSLCIISKPNNT